MSITDVPAGRTLARGTPTTVDGAIASFVEGLRAAEAELRGELDRITGRMLTDPSWSLSDRRQQVRGVLSATADLQADLAEQAQLFTRDTMARVYQGGQDRALRTLGLDPGAGSFTTPHRRAYERIAGDTFDDLVQGMQNLGPGARDRLRAATKLRTLTGGVAGASVPDDARALARRLQGTLAADGVTSLVDAGGARWSLSRYSEMVVRTKSAQAYNTGTVLQAAETGTGVFVISDGIPSGHDACARKNGRTCTAKWAIDHPIEHPNCVRSFGPSPLHEGPVDYGERDGAVEVTPPDEYTPDERAAMDELGQLRGAPSDELVARLPQDVPFDHPGGFTTHGGYQVGQGTGYVSNRTLAYIETGPDGWPTGGPFATAADAARAAAKEVRRATPSGLGEPAVRQLVYARGVNPEDAMWARRYNDPGFRSAGSSGGADVVMWGRDPARYAGAGRANAYIDPWVIHHEVGHSLMHVLNRKAATTTAARREAMRQQAAEELYDRADPMVLQGLRHVNDTLDAQSRRTIATLTLDDLDIARGPIVQQRAVALQAEGRGWSAAVAQAEREFDRAVDTFAGVRTTTMARVHEADRMVGDRATPGPAFARAGELDADRLENLQQRYDRLDRQAWDHTNDRKLTTGPYSNLVPEMAPSTRRELRPVTFVQSDKLDGHAVSVRGREAFENQPARPGVSNYAASVGEGVEDWAETWRLWTHDQAHGSLGADQLTGQPIRFADLFPERASFIRELLTLTDVAYP